MRERKWQTRETLARGVYGGYTPLYTNGKEKNGTTRNIEGLHQSFNAVLTWIQILLLAALNIVLKNKPG